MWRRLVARARAAAAWMPGIIISDRNARSYSGPSPLQSHRAPGPGRRGTKFSTVDEKGWRVLDPKCNAALLIRPNAIGHLLAFEVAAELRKIQADFFGVRIEERTHICGLAPARLVLEKPVMHLGEVSLQRGRLGGKGRFPRMPMNRERKVPKCHLNPGAISSLKLKDDRRKHRTRGTLKIGELIQFDRVARLGARARIQPRQRRFIFAPFRRKTQFRFVE